MTTAKQIANLKRSINLISRIARDIQTDDYEAQDALMRAARDVESDLFELELSLQPATDELALIA